MASFRQKILQKLINFWPPFLGAGISVTHAAEDFSTVDVKLKLTPFNRNYVGTQYGGSLYSMTDPFYMLILMERLGSDFIVWDKAANIRFKKPGKGTVFAHFEIADEVLAEIRQQVAQHNKTERVLTVHVVDKDGQVIAEVDKTLWIAKKSYVKERSP